MKNYVANIEEQTLANEDFRRVLFTTTKSQLVLMSLKPGEEIGLETHELDQFLRVEAGEGKVILDGVESPVADGTAIVVPAGTAHNLVNTSASAALKLYTLYMPPEHRDGTVHSTKEQALADAADHFDGRTSLD